MTNEKIILNSLAETDKEIATFWKEVDAAEKRLSAMLSKLLQEGDTVGSVDIAITKASVQQALVDSGYYKIVDRLLNDEYQTLLDRNIKDYKAMIGDFAYNGTSIEKLNAMKDLDLSQFGQLSDDLATQVTKHLINYQLGVITQNQAVTFMGQAAGDLGKYSKTWIDTATSAFYRTSNAQLGLDNGIKNYEYFGPDDKITRPFCREHLGEVKSWEEWAKITNGNQPGPVTVYGGGYGCRHVLTGIVDNA